MKKLSCIVEAGRVDSNGVQIDLAGLKVGGGQNTVIVTENFQGPPIGVATVKMSPEGLVAEMSLDEGQSKKRFWPAVGGSVISSEQNSEGVRVITGFTLKEIAICGQPNADPLIEPIEY